MSTKNELDETEIETRFNRLIDISSSQFSVLFDLSLFERFTFSAKKRHICEPHTGFII